MDRIYCDTDSIYDYTVQNVKERFDIIYGENVLKECKYKLLPNGFSPIAIFDYGFNKLCRIHFDCMHDMFMRISKHMLNYDRKYFYYSPRENKCFRCRFIKFASIPFTRFKVVINTRYKTIYFIIIIEC